MDNVLRAISDLSDAIQRNHMDDPEEARELHDVIREVLESQRDYFVAKLDTVIFSILPNQYLGMDPRHTADQRVDLDRKRRDKHIGMTVNMNKMNRLCKIEGVEPIWKLPGKGYREFDSNSIDDREEAAALCFSFVVQSYLSDHNRYLNQDIQQDEFLYQEGKEAAQEIQQDLEEMPETMRRVSIDYIHASNPIQAARHQTLDELLESVREEKEQEGQTQQHGRYHEDQREW